MIKEIINNHFSLESNKLFTIKELLNMINHEDIIQSYMLRTEYINNSFFLFNEDIIKEIIDIFKENNIEEVKEMQSGCGWLSHWINKYGFKVKNTFDSKEWEQFDGSFLDIVEKKSNHEVFENYKEKVDCVILSWPYMDENATEIWNSLDKGQYLLYIGEGKSGCTASDSFFDAVDGKEIYYFQNYKPFRAMHDRVTLYRK